MEIVIATAVGVFIGVSIWFPYKHVLNRLVAKKRETSAILNELSQSEQEHAAEMRYAQGQRTYRTTTTTGNTWTNPKSWTSTSGVNDLNVFYNTAVTTPSAAQFGNAQAGTGTTSPASVSSTSLNALYCTRCNSLVGSGPHSCESGTDAP